MKYKVRQTTSLGRKKQEKYKENQDSKLVDKGRNLFLLADGMGGGLGGKTAADVAITTAYEKLLFLSKGLKYGIYGKEDIQKCFQRAIEYANKCVYALSQGRLIKQDKSIEKIAPELDGCGTTLDIFYPFDDSAYIGHVGESRVYLFRNEILTQLTEDHSTVGFPLEELSKGEAKIASLEAKITNYIGMDKQIKSQFRDVALRPEDIILMATDGLTKVVDDSEISFILANYDFRYVPRELVRMANYPQRVPELFAKYQETSLKEAKAKLGGKDNVTIIAIKAYD